MNRILFVMAKLTSLTGSFGASLLGHQDTFEIYAIRDIQKGEELPAPQTSGALGGLAVAEHITT